MKAQCVSVKLLRIIRSKVGEIVKIMLLGPNRPLILDYLISFGDEVFQTEQPVSLQQMQDIDFLISYGYRYIIRPEILAKFPNKAINLHISLLPWNRGADPNLWSFLEDTPKGVTIHYLDEGIDTGEILGQRQLEFAADGTLRSTYEELLKNIEELFIELWPNIRDGNVKSLLQPPGGSCHRIKDKAPFQSLLNKEWHTPVKEIIGKAIKRS